jgi:protein SCO1
VYDVLIGNRGTRLCIAAVLVTLLAACGSGGGTGPVSGFRENHPDGFSGVVMEHPFRIQDVTLTDSEGQLYRTRSDTTRPLTLVFFGYTHCPDVCQIVMNDITAAIARLDDAERQQVGMLFISSDPTRDDPATLHQYLGRFNPHFEGLTGSLSSIKQVARSVGVEIEKGDRLPSGGYAVAHGTQVMGVTADGRTPLVWTDGFSSQDLAGDITKALREGIPTIGSDS